MGVTSRMIVLMESNTKMAEVPKRDPVCDVWQLSCCHAGTPCALCYQKQRYKKKVWPVVAILASSHLLSLPNHIPLLLVGHIPP